MSTWKVIVIVLIVLLIVWLLLDCGSHGHHQHNQQSQNVNNGSGMGSIPDYINTTNSYQGTPWNSAESLNTSQPINVTQLTNPVGGQNYGQLVQYANGYREVYGLMDANNQLGLRFDPQNNFVTIVTNAAVLNNGTGLLI